MKRGRRPVPVSVRMERNSHDEGDCRIWDGYLTDGYGHIYSQGRSRLVHRVAYELTRGPIPEGMEIDHKCFNRACIAPKHLRLATRSQNAAHRQGPGANRTGFRGVFVSNQCGRTRYGARVYVAGKSVHLGMFDTPEAAAEAAHSGRQQLHTFSEA